MRRTRFAGAVEIPDEAKSRASVREALWFDIEARVAAPADGGPINTGGAREGPPTARPR